MASYTIDDIEAVAGTRSYQRGIDYIDQVRDLAAGEGMVTAVVYGSDAYQVLWGTIWPRWGTTSWWSCC